MPSVSTRPPARRSPAMSSRVSGNPPRSIRTSRTSRVVPATSEVSAASRRASAFNSVDLPTFGRPTSATSKPSRTRSAIRPPLSFLLHRSMNRPQGVGDRREHRRRQLLVGEVDRSPRRRRAPAPASAPHSPPARHRPVHQPQRLPLLRGGLRARGDRPAPRPATDPAARSASARRVNSPGSACRKPSTPAQGRQHRPADRRAAVQLQLDHILAGEAPRRRECDHHRLVEPLAGLRIAAASAASQPAPARARPPSPAGRRQRLRPRDADDRKSSPASGSSLGKYRLAHSAARKELAKISCSSNRRTRRSSSSASAFQAGIRSRPSSPSD